MKRVVATTLFAVVLAPLYAAPQHPIVKKTAAASSSHKTATAARSAGHTSSSLHLVAATAKSAHSTGAVRGRASRGTRVVHAPAPTYQLHPDPERYQTIQKALADRGYFKGDPNGTWGDDSFDAMRRFQADQKIDNDGKIDSLSLIALGLGPKHDGTTAAEPRVSPGPDSVSSPSLIQPSSLQPSTVQPVTPSASGGRPIK